MTEIAPTDWEARLAEAVAKNVQRREARKVERAEFKRRRDYGLALRHAAKLNQQEKQQP